MSFSEKSGLKIRRELMRQLSAYFARRTFFLPANQRWLCISHFSDPSLTAFRKVAKGCFIDIPQTIKPELI
jgi:hypothetical protein